MKSLNNAIIYVCFLILFLNFCHAGFLYDYGKEKIVDYEKYGKILNNGTTYYKYVITDRQGLAEAVGEGIYPNTESVRKDPMYQKLFSEGKLKRSHWECVDTDDPIRDFYVWATAPEEPGVKQFFTAKALENAGEILHAIKAYYAVVVHFPGSACWAADKSFVWYVAPEAISRIEKLCDKYPELELKLVDAYVLIENGNDTDLKNDIVKVNIGKFVKFTKEDRTKKINLDELKIVEIRGKGKVQVVKFSNGHWQLRVNGKPFIVKGVSYVCSPVGQSPHNGTLENWQFMDKNNNGKIDGPYDSWVDKNKNNKRDKDEVVVGDFQLLKEMGCNAIRVYHNASNMEYVKGKEFNKKLLRELYEKYGIYVIMGDFLGAYTIGSAADWNLGTDYTDKTQLENMKKVVRDMVLENKDEPYVLMWLLGNENMNSDNPNAVNYTNTNANKYPAEYVKFVNEVAKMIHELDPDHPVAVGNLDTVNLSYYAKYAPEIDIFGCNAYRGKDGFGSLWKEVKLKYDRPVLITEYGCDAYWEGKGEDEEQQAEYHRGCWKDIIYNSAGNPGVGNSIGGIIFEWMDEWWKSGAAGWDGAPFEHDTQAQYKAPFPDGWAHEEWFGIVSMGNGYDSPFLRQLRKTYFVYKEELWKE